MAPAPRRWPIASVAVLLGLALTPWLMAFRMHDHSDFDLHYYGGRVERASTYTDRARVVAAGASEGVQVAPIPLGGPTLIALVFQPLSWLSLHAAQRIWLLMCCLLTGFAVWRAGRWRWSGWMLALSVLPGMTFALALGQPSLVTLALVLWAYAEFRDNNDVGAGVLVGVATALKLYPAFLLIAVIATRRWRALKWSLGTGAALTGARILALSPRDVVPAAREALGFATGSHLTMRTQSAGSLLSYLFDSPSAQFVAAPLLLAAATWWLLSRRRVDASLTFAATTLAMLLAQRQTWEHYLPLAIIGLIALVDAHAKPRALTLGALGYILMSWPGRADQMTYPTSMQTLASGVHVYAVALILLAVGLTLEQAGRRPPFGLPSYLDWRAGLMPGW